MPGLGWLHLTDLHVRTWGSLWQRTSLRDELERDLARVHESAGPFDLLIVTGDLAQSGTHTEFALALDVLTSLHDYLARLGSRPSLLAVPGNHDLVRTISNTAPNASGWENASETREAFFTDDEHPGRVVVRSAFAAFTQSMDAWNRAHPRVANLEIRPGLLPGDFVATLEKGESRFGIVGLNTAFLEVANDGAFGSLDVDPRQIRAAAGDLDEFARAHDASLLLTHHAPEALSAEARARFLETIAPRDRFAAHLCGSTRDGLPPPSRSGARHAIFAAHPFSGSFEAGEKRGYAAGRIDLPEGRPRDAARLRIWPRILQLTHLPPTFGPDETQDLGPDEAISRSLGPVLRAAPATTPVIGSAPGPAPTSAPPDFPPELDLLRSIPLERSPLARLRFSPRGDAIAALSYWGRISYFDSVTGARRWSQHTNTDALELCFAPDGKRLATRAGSHLAVFDAADGESLRSSHDLPGKSLAFAPGVIAAGDPRGAIRFFDADDLAPLGDLDHGFCPDGIFALSFSPDGEFLLSGGKGDGFVAISTIPVGALPHNGFTRAAHFHRGSVLDFAFRPRSVHVASCADDGTIAVWSLEDGSFLARLEGHVSAVTSLSFSHDGRLLASRSRDGAVLLWRTDAWELVARLRSSTTSHAGACFSPTEPILALPSPTGSLALLAVDIDALRGRARASSTRHTTTAKVVLLGEGRAGKSCLALRLAEDRFEEQPSTHGMRFWTIPEERLPRVTSGPKNHKREIVVWDLGGQDEYRLVHPLFLRDTELALLVFEPGRGKAAEDEIAALSDHLIEDEERGDPPKRLLVGTKLDQDEESEDRAAIERLRVRTGALAYTPTSALAGRGMTELQELVTTAIDWAELGPTSRPALFDRIRSLVDSARKTGRVVLTLPEIEAALSGEPDLERAAVAAVASQLARQGLVADIRLSDGTRALVLEVEQIARYAGSLILLARQNPHGVPALDIASLLVPTARFPRIPQAARLRKDQELGVLDGVISLLIERGTCFLHEGLLVFPSLFPAPAAGEPEIGPRFPPAITYEMSRPAADVHASTIAAIALSRRFGPARLGPGRADFGMPGEGTSRISMIPPLAGKARGALALSFSPDTPDDVRRLFAGFVEDHFRLRGVHFVEKAAIHCACGHLFDPEVVSRRLVAGHSDVGCPECDLRTPLVPRGPSGEALSLSGPIFALRREAERRREESVEAARFAITTARLKEDEPPSPLRILHLSDLHFRESDDPEALLSPLCVDLRDRLEGLSLEKLDFVAVTGDLTNRASQGELERARVFLSRLLDEMGLTAERLLVVPGNHDLDWDTEVYDFRKKRALEPARLPPGSFVEQANGFLVRDDARYPARFGNFSRHLYHPLFLREYPLAPEEQGLSALFAAERLQFFAWNSSFQIDEYFPGRAAIHPGALSRALDAGERQVREARARGDLGKDTPVLRISLFHHPVSGGELMEDRGFVEQLRKSDVRVALHGHVHEERAALEGHLARSRKLHIVGAGSFGAPGSARPESVPRLYNLLTLPRNLGRMRVDTRCLRRATGAWEAWSVWPGERPGEKRAHYEVELA